LILEKMKNDLSAFERGLKSKLENYEMPHSEQEWMGIQSSLGVKSVSWAKKIIIGSLVAGGFFAIYLTANQKNDLTCKKVDMTTRFTEPFNIFNLSVSSNVDEQASVSVVGEETINVHSTESASATNKASNILLVSQESTVSQKAIDNNTNEGQETLAPSNVISLASNVRKACMGEEVLFSMTNGPKGGSYLWNFGDGHFSDESNPKHRFNKAGKYDVSLSITTEDGQINTTVMSDMINIIDSPDAYFFWEFVDGIPNQPIAIIREESSGADMYQWTLPDGKEISEREPGKLNLLPGNNKIVLKASNKNGCYTEVERVILVKENSDPNVIHGAESFMPQFLKKNKGRFEVSYTLLSFESNMESTNLPLFFFRN